MKNKKTLWFVLAAAVLTACLLFLHFHSENHRLLGSFASSDAAYQLDVYEIGDPQFPYGEGKCRLVLKAKNKTISKTDVTLKNDGKHADMENFTAVFEADRVTVTVTAEEQDPEILNLFYDGTADKTQ